MCRIVSYLKFCPLDTTDATGRVSPSQFSAKGELRFGEIVSAREMDISLYRFPTGNVRRSVQPAIDRYNTKIFNYKNVRQLPSHVTLLLHTLKSTWKYEIISLVPLCHFYNGLMEANFDGDGCPEAQRSKQGGNCK